MTNTTDPTFRSFPPELSTNAQGEPVWVILCADLVDGRWEPFVIITAVK